jgi:alkanesulfonate monooxygenase SsuD/methylene tetrahydromethanopterin reductase-like flavin-dependent oxidoreductase (luciferase family)
MKFGVLAMQYVPWDELVRRWKAIEGFGFDSVYLADHFLTIPWFECWTTLAALASQTSRIRIGTLVSPIPFHNPAILARKVMTLDHVSNGRLVLGLGPGGHVKDHAMTGIPDHSNRERVDRFGEFVEIVDQLLRNEVTSYEGRYYTIKDTAVTPSTVQRPRPPILIAAHGARMLRHTAKYADIWNTMGTSPSRKPSSLDERLEAVRQQSKFLNTYCQGVGRDPRTIKRSVLLSDPKMFTNKWRLDYYESVDAFKDVATRYQALGIDECILWYPYVDEQLSVFRHIAQEVIPDFKQKS